jgi:hypothetical protein
MPYTDAAALGVPIVSISTSWFSHERESGTGDTVWPERLAFRAKFRER